jgi:hypothetical protein
LLLSLAVLVHVVEQKVGVDSGQQCPPELWGADAGQQMPVEQTWPGMHGLPHLPQSVSVSRLLHPSGQHDCPLVHVIPHVEQFAALLRTHAPLQQRSPGLQWVHIEPQWLTSLGKHLPLQQTSPELHMELSQPPQCCGLVMKSTHCVWQQLWFIAAQFSAQPVHCTDVDATQLPWQQALPAPAHVLPHAPQLPMSEPVLVHTIAQHACPLAQRIPQCPQLAVFDVSSTQLPEQHESPMPHARVQDPQCARSVPSSMHVPLQHDRPLGHRGI